MSNLEIPADFPVERVIAAVSGAQAKMPMVEVGGKYYDHGTSPSEVAAAYALCEDLAAQLTAYCERKFTEGICTKNWCTAQQANWTLRRTATLLRWDLPKDFPTL
jgi:hypothetical protein